MRKDIHPQYHKINVICSCGNKFVTRSVLGSELLRVEICSKCHPFATDKSRVIDTAGRIDNFNRRYRKSSRVKSSSSNNSLGQTET